MKLQKELDTSTLSYSPYEDSSLEAARSKRRSDKSIREEIYEMLSNHTVIHAEDIHVSVSEGDVTLAGTVPERTMKTLAEEVAEKCFGIRDVLNQIDSRS